MKKWRVFCETVHLSALGVWCGALLMAAAAASIIFPTAKALEPSLPAYAAYEGEHWRIIAGQMGAKIFFATDIVQFMCVLLAFVALIGISITGGLQRGRSSSVVRVIGLLSAFVLFTWQFFMLSGEMNREMVAFWKAAEAGLNDEAEALRASFDAKHPTASRLMMGTTISVLVALLSGIWCAVGRDLPTREPKPEKGDTKLEEPRLARR